MKLSKKTPVQRIAELEKSFEWYVREYANGFRTELNNLRARIEFLESKIYKDGE